MAYLRREPGAFATSGLFSNDRASSGPGHQPSAGGVPSHAPPLARAGNGARLVRGAPNSFPAQAPAMCRAGTRTYGATVKAWATAGDDRPLLKPGVPINAAARPISTGAKRTFSLPVFHRSTPGRPWRERRPSSKQYGDAAAAGRGRPRKARDGSFRTGCSARYGGHSRHSNAWGAIRRRGHDASHTDVRKLYFQPPAGGPMFRSVVVRTELLPSPRGMRCGWFVSVRQELFEPF